VAKKKMSRADRLQALRDKLATTDMGTSSGFMRLEEGLNQVRILPEAGDMGFFFQAVGTHRFDDGRTAYCPKFTSEGYLDCPICELVDELYQAGDKASKALGQKLRVRRKFWMNVIDRAKEDRGPLILTAGVTIFSPVAALVNDPEYGFIYDLEDGTDIKIRREGTGLDTTYDVIAARKESPLSDDPDIVEDWMKAARDLSYVELSDDPEEDDDLKGNHAVYVLPYDRILEEYNLDDAAAEEPTRRRKKKVTPKRAKEELYDEDDEDEEEESEVKKDIRRRVTRRRRA